MSNFSSLASLGWQPFFQQQLSLEEWNDSAPARVIEQHKSAVRVATHEWALNLDLLSSMPNFVVGDWLLLNADRRFTRLLERKTCFARKAAGTGIRRQLIAANIDTAFIVSSMNEDFNLNRLERFLAVVNEAGAEPVIVLSKADKCTQPIQFVDQAQGLDPFLAVVAVNSLNAESVAQLSPWTCEGKTVTVVGSSGVGKSSLVNTLLEDDQQTTRGIREDDDKGRHTTTRRSLFALPGGGLILDTPGMREIQLVESREGIATTFSDIEELSGNCQFSDCHHLTEPGCAVIDAIATGMLEQRRFNNYLKLRRENDRNSASLAEGRANAKAQGKFYKKTQSEAKRLKGR
ncbi:Small ribosomal subunit biogenesis GTPase RsgA [Halioglobus japonicus]|nr:Small ribosomal subunit biogenesis GTPase RsgA [Halioglobus japonicus]